MILFSLDSWSKLAQIVQGFATPLIAVFIGIITYRIQRQQANIQQQQATINHLQHRLALMDRRMKVFNSTLEFVVLVVREAQVASLDSLFKLLRDTREHALLFGSEIGAHINELYTKGVRLHTIYEMSGPQQVIRPEDISVKAEIIQWFSGQIKVTEEKFLKYIDFREP